MEPIYSKYHNLSRKNKKKLPSYCCAAVLLVMAISFFSSGMAYKAKANDDRFSTEHGIIDTYIDEWRNTFRRQTRGVKFIVGFPFEETTAGKGGVTLEVSPQL